MGNTITLLLGKGGGVADAVSSTVINESVVVYVAELGTKNYLNADGQEYASAYIRGVSTAGDEIEYPATPSWIKRGDVVRIEFGANGAEFYKESGGTIAGVVDASLRAIGNTPLAQDVRIIDAAGGAYTSVSVSRLAGMRLETGDVLYSSAVNGTLTALILNDATGDCGAYGVITSAKRTSATDSVSGEYSWMIDGIPASASTQGSAFSAGAGPAKISLSGNSPESMQNLRRLASKVSAFTGDDLSCDGEIKRWLVSGKVGVYYASPLPTQYTHATPADALAAYAASSDSLEFYYDALPEDGGQIRVILIKQS
jgi:hypothetical protein